MSPSWNQHIDQSEPICSPPLSKWSTCRGVSLLSNLKFPSKFYLLIMMAQRIKLYEVDNELWPMIEQINKILNIIRKSHILIIIFSKRIPWAKPPSLNYSRETLPQFIHIIPLHILEMKPTWYGCSRRSEIEGWF